jgi:spoIIIJ-associated protein
VKDALFSGPDVPAALDAASRALGIAPAQLRYVVLQEATSGRLGLQAQPARIAILMDSGGRSAPASGSLPVENEAEAEDYPDLAEQIAELGRQLAEETGLQIALTTTENDGRLDVRFEGTDAAGLLAEEGVAAAFEHILRRWADRNGEEIRVAGAGHRERRDEALRQRALRLAEEVRVDGQPRRVEGLNSYERRIVHVALEGAEGVETFSVGEGTERRVVIAPRVPTGEGD